MDYLDLPPEQFTAFKALPIDGQVRMLNLLKFKDQVVETGKSGVETYRDYMKATEPFFSVANAKVIYFGTAKFSLIGPENPEWDKVLLVEYATKQDFINMITAPGYPAALRKMALKDSRLIFCQ